MMQFILYIVKNCVAVTIGTYIGCNLCYYSDIARNELKKHYFELELFRVVLFIIIYQLQRVCIHSNGCYCLLCLH